MKKIGRTDVIFSSLFFILALFTLFVLSLSGSVDGFKQLFSLVTKPYGVYCTIGMIFLVCGLFLSLFTLVRLNHSPTQKIYIFAVFVMSCLFAWILYYEFFIFERFYHNPYSLEELLQLTQEDALKKTLFQRSLDYGYYILFIIFPITIHLRDLHFDRSSKLGSLLQLTLPNMNLNLCVLFGFSIFPFFSETMGIFDCTLVIAGLFCFGYIHIKKRYLINSYEYFNFLLLLILIVVLLFSYYHYVNSESYFEIRRSFYYLALFAWCNDWMNKIKTSDRR